MASALLSKRRKGKESSVPTVMVSGPKSINDLPDEVLLKILSHFGPDDLCFKIAEVCGRWNALSRDVTIWKKISYSCYFSSDINYDIKVTCCNVTVSTNWLMKLATSSVLIGKKAFLKLDLMKERFIEEYIV
jgi:hypothetical protein